VIHIIIIFRDRYIVEAQLSLLLAGKSSSLLKDGSWIKRVDDEDEDVE